MALSYLHVKIKNLCGRSKLLCNLILTCINHVVPKSDHFAKNPFPLGPENLRVREKNLPIYRYTKLVTN